MVVLSWIAPLLDVLWGALGLVLHFFFLLFVVVVFVGLVCFLVLFLSRHFDGSSYEYIQPFYF